MTVLMGDVDADDEAGEIATTSNSVKDDDEKDIWRSEDCLCEAAGGVESGSDGDGDGGKGGGGFVDGGAMVGSVWYTPRLVLAVEVLVVEMASCFFFFLGEVDARPGGTLCLEAATSDTLKVLESVCFSVTRPSLRLAFICWRTLAISAQGCLNLELGCLLGWVLVKTTTSSGWSDQVTLLDDELLDLLLLVAMIPGRLALMHVEHW